MTAAVTGLPSDGAMETPSRKGAPTASSPTSGSIASKPRLLYRGPLRLSDGTLLPGVAFISTAKSPFEQSASPSSSRISQRGAADTEDADYDAEISLALEMVRGNRVVGIDVLDERSSVVARTASGKEIVSDVDLEATGNIKMYIDPSCLQTASFFKRNFCWQDNWSAPCGGAEEGVTKARSKIVFALSTMSSTDEGYFSPSVTASSNGVPSRSQSNDPFVTSCAGQSAPTSTSLRRSDDALQLVLFAKMGSEGCDSDGGRTLDLLVGRRILKKRKVSAPSQLPASASSSSWQQSQLHKLSRQSNATRPDDPLPRSVTVTDASVASGSMRPPWLQGASLKSGERGIRKTLSAPQLPEHLVKRRASDHSELAAVQEEEDEAVASGRANGSCASTISAKGGTKGNHTPGRRGEKRRRPPETAEMERATSPTSSLSLKREKATLDDDSRDASASRPAPLLRPPSSKKPFGRSASTSQALTSGSASASRVPLRPPSLSLHPSDPALSRRTSRSRQTTATPEPPDSACFASFEDSFESTAEAQEEAAVAARTNGAQSSKAPLSTADQRDRGIIKKLITYQLLGRGLVRGVDADFERCFSATYQGTLLAMRHHHPSAGSQHDRTTVDSFDRARAARIIAVHLEMYLPMELPSSLAAVHASCRSVAPTVSAPVPSKDAPSNKATSASGAEVPSAKKDGLDESLRAKGSGGLGGNDEAMAESLC